MGAGALEPAIPGPMGQPTAVPGTTANNAMREMPMLHSATIMPLR